MRPRPRALSARPDDEHRESGPLRERGDDAVDLALRFIRTFASELSTDKDLSESAIAAIRQHDWSAVSGESRLRFLTRRRVEVADRVLSQIDFARVLARPTKEAQQLEPCDTEEVRAKTRDLAHALALLQAHREGALHELGALLGHFVARSRRADRGPKCSNANPGGSSWT